MCPPPSEPIRPIGALDGSVYVDRIREADRVVRRRSRDAEEDGDGRRDERHEQADARQRRERWTGSATPLDAAGTYDDHGRALARTRAAAAEAAAEQAHVDRTA